MVATDAFLYADVAQQAFDVRPHPDTGVGLSDSVGACCFGVADGAFGVALDAFGGSDVTFIVASTGFDASDEAEAGDSGLTVGVAFGGFDVAAQAFDELGQVTFISAVSPARARCAPARRARRR